MNQLAEQSEGEQKKRKERKCEKGLNEIRREERKGDKGRWTPVPVIPDFSTHFLTSEYPLECTPDDRRPERELENEILLLQDWRGYWGMQ